MSEKPYCVSNFKETSHKYGQFSLIRIAKVDNYCKIQEEIGPVSYNILLTCFTLVKIGSFARFIQERCKHSRNLLVFEVFHR